MNTKPDWQLEDLTRTRGLTTLTLILLRLKLPPLGF